MLKQREFLKVDQFPYPVFFTCLFLLRKDTIICENDTVCDPLLSKTRTIWNVGIVALNTDHPLPWDKHVCTQLIGQNFEKEQTDIDYVHVGAFTKGALQTL